MYSVGDEVICRDHYFDVLTVLIVDYDQQELTCFEYDINDCYVFDFDEVEKLEIA